MRDEIVAEPTVNVDFSNFKAFSPEQPRASLI
jgi:hypothetical protein